MKKLILFYCLVFFFVTTGVLFAGGTKRTAIIEDSADVTTIVNSFDFSADFSQFGFGINYIDNPFFDKPCIGVKTKVFDIAILIDSLISIEAKKGYATVAYRLQGQEKKLAGELVKGDFLGKCNFGDFSLSTDKLKKLTFRQPAINKAQKQTKSLTDTLVLTNGSRISVAKLRRCSTTLSTMFVGVSDYSQFDDIRFLMGESQFIVDFKKIKKISFQSGKNVIVTLKNGSTNTGILPNPDGNGAEVVGFTGTCGEGEFFISVKKVQAIELGN
jgi:hypothetical protein